MIDTSCFFLVFTRDSEGFDRFCSSEIVLVSSIRFRSLSFRERFKEAVIDIFF